MHPWNYIFAYHIDSTTLADGDYELIPEQEVEISEDPGNIVGNLTEAPNQSSKNLDTPAPNPTQEGKPRCITQYFKLLHYAILHLYILALSLGVKMEP
jgi:outer membrane protein assembly factor BamE (lipoprotein component of BamABCDE complex)